MMNAFALTGRIIIISVIAKTEHIGRGDERRDETTYYGEGVVFNKWREE